MLRGLTRRKFSLVFGAIFVLLFFVSVGFYYMQTRAEAGSHLVTEKEEWYDGYLTNIDYLSSPGSIKLQKDDVPVAHYYPELDFDSEGNVIINWKGPNGTQKIASSGMKLWFPDKAFGSGDKTRLQADASGRIYFPNTNKLDIFDGDGAFLKAIDWPNNTYTYDVTPSGNTIYLQGGMLGSIDYDENVIFEVAVADARIPVYTENNDYFYNTSRVETYEGSGNYHIAMEKRSASSGSPLWSQVFLDYEDYGSYYRLPGQPAEDSEGDLWQTFGVSLDQYHPGCTPDPGQTICYFNSAQEFDSITGAIKNSYTFSTDYWGSSYGEYSKNTTFDSDGNLYYAYDTASGLMVKSFSPAGGLRWEKALWEGSNGPWLKTSSGYVWVTASNSSGDIVVQKIASDGTEQFAEPIRVNSDFDTTFRLSGTHWTGYNQIDGTSDLESWDSFTPTQTVPANTSIEYEFRSSDDATIWSSWSAPQAYGGTALDLSAVEARRYLQVRATLETTDNQVTPQIDDYTINYTTTDSGTDPPTCDDGIQNGDETGVDCGGSCDACPVPPACDDGIQNGDETGVDCGGSCLPCEPEPTCFDGIQNGDETGVDCGGSCPPCPAPPAEPSCVDAIQNQGEEGIDCGGPCPACPIACPLPDPAWCDTLTCQNNITILSPQSGERYQTGDVVSVEWLNSSNALSLIEGWNIRYNIDISYNGGNNWTRIASDISDVNFSNVSSWQGVFADTNWQDRIKGNKYLFSIPKTESVITEQAKVRVSMYRTSNNPYGCSSYAFDISNNFTIYKGEIVSKCSVESYTFLSPNVIRSALDQDAFIYFLTQDQASAWPDINLTLSLQKNPGNIIVPIDQFMVEPSGLGSFDDYGRFNVQKEHVSPQNFKLSYYDFECDKTISLQVIYQDDITNGQWVKVLVPNGGERWLLGREYPILWQSSYDKGTIDSIKILLSLDGGTSWGYDISRNSADSYRSEYIKVSNLLDQNSFQWEIPLDEALLSKTARIKVVAFDKSGKLLGSDTSDEDFEISTSMAGAVIDSIKDNISALALALIIISALNTIIVSLIPVMQNYLATATFWEFLRGILLAGRRKKKTWGLVYDAQTGLPLPFAVVSLHDQASNRLVETTTTNKEGRYGFVADEGSYFIRVDKKSYEIADPKILENQALKYEGNYFGGTIEVQNEEQVISANIPMSATGAFSTAIRQINILSAIGRALTLLNWPLIISGTLVSMIALYYYFSTYNLVIMLLYLPIWFMQISQIRKVKAHGLVLEYFNHEPIDLALVRVLDHNGKLFRTAASDLKGHYGLMINRGDYRLVCQKPGFVSSKVADLEIEEGIKPLSETFYLSAINQ